MIRTLLRITRVTVVGLTCAFTPAAFGAGWNVGVGSIVHFGDARVDFGCGNLEIAGTADTTSATLISIDNLDIAEGGSFAAGAAVLNVGGNFSDAGAFAPGTGVVNVVDACGSGTSAFSGATSFYDLTIMSGTGKQAILPVGVAQSVAHALTLQGAAGQLLTIASPVAGQRGILALASGAAQSIAYIDVRDNEARATRIAPGAPAQFHSVDGGNLLNWFTNAAVVGGGAVAVPAPVLGFGRWLLFAGLLFAAWRALSSSRSKHS